MFDVNRLSFRTNIRIAFFGGALVTALSYVVPLALGYIDHVDWLEIFSVYTSFACTYLCVVQTRWNYPIGVISVAALTFLFYRQGLYGSASLNAYLFISLGYGWWRWREDKNTLPVRHLGLNWWLLAYAIVTLFAFVVSYKLNSLLGGEMAFWDATILILSILAQNMLDNKRLENWLVWVVVDVISVVEYWNQGLKVLAIQMALFGLNAVWAYYSWRRSMNTFENRLKVAYPHKSFDAFCSSYIERQKRSK